MVNIRLKYNFVLAELSFRKLGCIDDLSMTTKSRGFSAVLLLSPTSNVNRLGLAVLRVAAVHPWLPYHIAVECN